MFQKKPTFSNCFLACFLFVAGTLFVQNLSAQEGKPRFTENKGQWQPQILFNLPLQGGDISFEKDRLTYRFMEPDYFDHDHHDPKEEKPHKELFNGHIYQVVFVGANPNATCKGQKTYPDVANYYIGNDPKHWADNVKIFEDITYKDLYPGIDVHFYESKGTLKYDFIIQAGADPHQIQLQYLGLEDVQLVDKEIHIQTTVNSVRELAPFAYTDNATQSPVACEYHLENKMLTFDFPDGWDHTQPLVIDPTLIFSTFTGSTQDNWGFTATYDNAGNAYAGGIIYNQGFLLVGSTGYPTTPGAFQSSFQGGVRDAAITKFNATGTTRIFSTYLGGSEEDQPHSMVVNSVGELFVMGRTLSFNFPTTNGAYDQTHNGGADIFVAKFGLTGSLLSSTFVGGSGDDANNGYYLVTGDPLNYNYSDDARGEIFMDLTDNPIIASCTRSFNFPTTAGAIDNTLGGIQDAVVFKLNNGLSNLTWSTYLGGAGQDAAYSLKADNLGNVYVAGGTMGNGFPTTAGTVYSSAQGGVDGFISKINATGTALLASTYMGTSSYDQCYFVELDANYNVYVTGQSLGNFPIINATYSVANSRQFISKLNNNLTSFIYSTTFGSAGATNVNISPTAFLVDVCENVYVAGWGGNINTYLGANGNTFGMPISSNSYDNTTDGSDFYFIVIQSNAAALLYGTYFGQGNDEHVDGGTSRFDPNGIVYEAVCGGCGGTSAFPTTSGVWSTTNNSNNCNLALFKFQFDFAGVNANFVPTINAVPTYEGCVPSTFLFQNNSTLGPNVQYQWNFGDNTTSTAVTPTHTYNAPGNYLITLIVSDPSSAACTVPDTAYQLVIIHPLPAPNFTLPASVCQGTAVTATYTGTPSQFYTWNFGGSTGGGTGVGPHNLTWNTAGTFTVSITTTDSNGCTNGPINKNITVNPIPTSAFSLSDSVCIGSLALATYTGTANASATYSWNFGSGTANPGGTVQGPHSIDYGNQGTYSVSLTVTQNGCTSPPTTQSVFVGQAPGGAFTLPDSACVGEVVQAVYTGAGGSGTVFNWNFGNANGGGTGAGPHNLSWTQTGTQQVSLTAAVNGCPSNTVTESIVISPIPTSPFTAPDSICVGTNATLTYTGNASTNANYTWSYPGGTLVSGSGQGPLNIGYAATGTYNTSLVVSENGCTSPQTNNTIFVGQAPVVSFTLPDSACVGEVVQAVYTGTTSGNIVYSWNFGTASGGSQSQGPHNLSWTAIGNQTVSMNAVVDGCPSNTVTENIIISPVPTSPFVAPDSVCLGTQVTLTYQGSASASANYSWSYPGGTLVSGTGQGPLTINYATPGSYTATLVVSENGCTSPASTQTIAVLPIPVAQFNLPDTLCIGNTATLVYTGANYPSAIYNWNFGPAIGGGTGPGPFALNWPSTGVFTVSLTVSSLGCVSPLYQENIEIKPGPSSLFSATPNICINDSATITYLGPNNPNYSFFWGFDGGIGVPGTGIGPHQVAWQTVGTKDITLQVAINGCAGLPTTQPVEVYQPPVPNFAYPNFVCRLDTNQIVYTGIGTANATYVWSFGSDAVVVSGSGQGPYLVYWLTPGVKTVCVQVTEPSCPPSPTFCQTLTILDQPIAGVAPVANQCFTNNCVNFTYTGQPNMDAYYWSFPNGFPASSNLPNPPCVQYTSVGTYTASLYVINDGCVSDTVFVTFDIVPEPSAFFTFDGLPCQGNCIEFDHVGIPSFPNQAYSWNFGPNAAVQYSTLEDLNCVIFNAPGLQTVSLSVNYKGCLDTFTQVVDIKPIPQVFAGLDSGFCEGLGPLQLNATVTNGSTPYYYTWTDIPAGAAGFNNVAIEDPTVNPGIPVTCILFVQDGHGCSSNRDSVLITPYARPLVVAGPDQKLCFAPNSPPVQLLGGPAPNNQAPLPFTYQWTPTTGMVAGQSTQQQPFVHPSQTTIYTLTATSAEGCNSDPLDTASTVIVDVVPIPTVNAGPTLEICLGDSVQFQGGAIGTGPYNFYWTPVTPSAGVTDPTNPNSYVSPTLTTVYTLVAEAQGCQGSDTTRVIVHTLPTAAIQPKVSEVCKGDTLTLNGHAFGDPDGVLYQYQWNSPVATFSNPNAATTKCVFNTAGTVYLSVSTVHCAGTTDSMSAIISPTPVPTILNVDTTICAGASVNLVSTLGWNGSPVGSPVIFDWSPAGGFTQNTTVSPTQTTTYTLTTSVAGECPRADEVTIFVSPTPSAMATADTYTLCEGSTTTLHASGGISNTATYSWSPANGLNNALAQHPVLLAPYTNPAQYNVWVKDGLCSDSASVTLTVYPQPVADYHATSLSGCVPLTVYLEQTGQNGVAYIWNFGDGTAVSNLPQVSHTYTQAGTFLPTLTLIGLGGCSTSMQIDTVTASDTGFAFFTSNPSKDSILYLPETAVMFQDGSPQAVNWLWDFGDGTYAQEQNPTHTFTQVGSYTVTLTATNESGCVATYSQSAYVVSDYNIFIPNIFTPNGDNIHDDWGVEYTGKENFEAEVYDRWGVKYYLSDSPLKKWDGTTLSGTKASDGVYFYSLRIGNKVYNGTVTLMR